MNRPAHVEERRHHDGFHIEPRTPYERMLDHAGLDCSRAGCWKPIAAMVQERDRVIGYCSPHALQFGTLATTGWLEA